MLEKCVLFVYITGKEKIVFLVGNKKVSNVLAGGEADGLLLAEGDWHSWQAGLKCTDSLGRRNPAAPLSLLLAQSLGWGSSVQRILPLESTLSLVTTSREPGTVWFA